MGARLEPYDQQGDDDRNDHRHRKADADQSDQDPSDQQSDDRRPAERESRPVFRQDAEKPYRIRVPQSSGFLVEPSGG